MTNQATFLPRVLWEGFLSMTDVPRPVRGIIEMVVQCRIVEVQAEQPFDVTDTTCVVERTSINSHGETVWHRIPFHSPEAIMAVWQAFRAMSREDVTL